MTVTQSENNSIVRLKKLEIENFRGLIGRRTLDVDADLVLIDGPNGYGKTSLLEAIILLLTGWHPALIDGKPVASRQLTGSSGGARYAEGTLSAIAVKKARKTSKDKEAEEPSEDKEAEETCEEVVIGIELSDYPSRPNGIDDSFFKKPDKQDSEDEQDWDAWELEGRLMSFFQERVRQSFDDAVRGRTLSEALNENPYRVTKTMEAVKRADAELARKLNKNRDELDKLRSNEESWRQAIPEFGKWIDAFHSLHHTIREYFARWPTMPPIRDGSDHNTSYDKDSLDPLEVFADEWMQEETGSHFFDPGTFLQRYREAVRSRIEEYRRDSDSDIENKEYKKLKEKLTECEREIAQIDRNYPSLERDVDRFIYHFRDGLYHCDVRLSAARWFSILSEKADEWAKLAREASGMGRDSGASPLARVSRELEQVDPDAAWQLAKALYDWIKPREEAWNRRKALEEERRDLKEQLDEIRTSEKLDQLESLNDRFRLVAQELEKYWKSQRKARDAVNRKNELEAEKAFFLDAREALDQFNTALDKITAPSSEIADKVVIMLNRLMFRFSLVEGFLPVKIDESNNERWMPLTNDERKIDDLSTGQKAQLAVGLMAAQNLAVGSDRLPSILVLDDVSSAYDLSNLTREALLWRQLAYGGKGKHKRQVFISSHHEDMTNNLIDLLMPPDGKRMRLLRFVGWRPDTGPEIEQYEVDPTAAVRCRDGKADSQELKSFTEALCHLPF